MTNNARKHLTFFVDPSWKRAGQYSPLLYPFWGNPLTEHTPFQKVLFDRYSFDTRCYSITDDPATADIVLMPYAHNMAMRHFPEMLAECVRVATQMKKPLLVDGTGDIEHVLTIPGVFVLRYGGYRFEKRPNEIHIPLYADDLLEHYRGGELSVRTKSVQPVVGFAGWGALTPLQRIKSVLKELPDRVHSVWDRRYVAKRKGVFFREAAMRALESSDLVTARVLRRGSYSGHVHTVDGEAQKIRAEFVANLDESDYCLDVRGDANASIRLFEILSLGRIPVIIDTERNFPFSDQLDYRTFALVVDFHDLARLPQIISEFHKRLTNEEFQTMQKNAREAYRTYFRVDALMPHIVDELTRRTAGEK